MEFFEPKNQMEQYLRQRCAAALQPFAGVMELIPADRRYVSGSIPDSKLLTTDQWLSLIDQAADMGVYALRLSGGDPLTHPDFRRIYLHLCDSGIAVTLDTDGLLLDEETITFLQSTGCRQININLYGANNTSYELSCGISNGFDCLVQVLNLLKTYHMPVNLQVQLTPYNIYQINAIDGIAKEFGFPVDYSGYTFPAIRAERSPENIQETAANASPTTSPEEPRRISPAEAAEATIKCFLLNTPQADYISSCRYTLSKLSNPEKFSDLSSGFTCHAAKSDFWITWDGELLPCGMFRDEKLHYNLKEHSFADCWSRMTDTVHTYSCLCEECVSCNMRDLCQSCPAACHAETGSMNSKPEYLCRMTEEIIHICREAIEESASEKPLLSIIIPVYNVENYISQCITSFLRQDLSAWEMILIDDGSTDRSGELCDQYAANDNRIRVIHQTNRGVSAARNHGLTAASADYIVFCDSDDYVEPDYCRILYHMIKDRPDTFITANTWCGTDSSPRQLQIGSDYTDPDHITIEEARCNPVFAYVWNSIYSRKIITDHNIRFDEGCSYNEDIQFNEEYLRYCQDGAFIRQPLYVHLIHMNGLVVQEFERTGRRFEDLNILEHGKLIPVNSHSK